MWIQQLLPFFFFKNRPKQKVNDPKWPWGDHWPHFCCGHPCDYPRIICPNSMEIHQSMWIPWPLKKGHDFKWPRGDTWPHSCWGHLCNSNQGSFWSSPMKIHQIGGCSDHLEIPKVKVSLCPVRTETKMSVFLLVFLYIQNQLHQTKYYNGLDGTAFRSRWFWESLP